MTQPHVRKYITGHFGIRESLLNFLEECETEAGPYFQRAQTVCEANQYKVIRAFQKNRVSSRHFAPTTGYGYSDEGRECLSRVFSDSFGSEDAIVSPLLMSGTHAITTALFGLLRPGDTMLCATGRPYDTLHKTIHGPGTGSLIDWGVGCIEQPLIGGKIDTSGILHTIRKKVSDIKLVYIQRSCGYDIRPAVSIEEIRQLAGTVRTANPGILVMVDNCYGEFTETSEPTESGADVIAGSLIKNPGGGLAPSGGYIAGRTDLIAKISHRFTAPGIGAQIGSYAASYQPLFQGLFIAPHTVCQAMMGVILASLVFNKIGYEVYPAPDEYRSDITQAILFGDERKLTSFVRGIQKASAVDSNVVPYAWDMPGYPDRVIMAAGTFVQGASLELTADAPIREPYAAYLQGALTYEHAKLGILYALMELNVKI